MARAIFSVILLSTLSSGAFAQARVNKYTMTTPTLTWTEISGTGVEFAGGPIRYYSSCQTTLPFAFNYDNTALAANSELFLWEGTVQLAGNTNTNYYEAQYAGTSSLPGTICYAATYGFIGSGDLGGNAYYQLTGTAPNREFTLEMQNCHSFGTGSNTVCSVQIHFFETTNVIQIQYQTHGTSAWSDEPMTIALDGFTSPSFAEVTIATNQSSSPSTDYQFASAPPQELALETVPPVFPKTLNFGTTNNQTPVTMSVTATSVGKTGSAPLTISGYSFTGSSYFTMTSAPPVIGSTLTATPVTYTFKFLPFTNGNLSATFTLTTNGVDSGSQTITLNGIGAVPSVSYSSNAMFRGVNTEVTDTSGVQYLYVNATTPPGGGPVVVNSVNFIGVDGGKAYFITHLPSGPLAPGAVDSIGVRFVPDLEGEPDAHMVINTTALNLPWDTVGMYGVGILPHLAVDSAKSWPLPTTVNFDSVKLGSDSIITVQLTNPGSDTVAIERNFFESNDPDFTIVPVTGSDTLIAPGGMENIQITFTPTQQGTRVAEIRIRTNIPHTETNPARDTSQFIINVIGIGVPNGKLSVTGPATNGNVSVGKSGCVTDTLWNTGAASLTVNTLTVTGTNGTDFTVSGFTPGTVLAPNSSSLFQVCADPSDTGAASALLTANGTSSEKPISATLNLGVYGLLIADTTIVVQPFAEGSCGTDTMIVTVTNTGNVSESYTGSIPLSPNFTLLGSGTTPLTSAGGVDTFLVLFTPTSGTATGMLNVISAAGSNSIPLSASGGAATIAGTQAAPITSIGNTSANFTVMVNNTGTCPWTSGTRTDDPQFTYRERRPVRSRLPAAHRSMFTLTRQMWQAEPPIL